MNEIGRKIVDKLIEIHGSTDFTIAFLPYKRSMWNSMESVYQECIVSGIDAHCMPIPYYRMKEEYQVDYIDSDFDLFGEIAEPVELLEDLDPDYVAIHYQYENRNKVTNMLPEFFTAAIKERYDCKIIYLPYGIYGNQSWFSLQPGCRHIDYGFLEDENAVNLFITGWQTQGVDFTGRVFAFGSPKLDAARKISKAIPEEWADIIGNRYVTLLCNSLGPYLSDPYEHILMYTLEVKNITEGGGAVIFRPHPLLATTIKSMVPGTEWRYIQMLNEFRGMPHVIVDDSEYLERALCAADELVSDPSSVLAMWRKTGKPWRILG